MIQSESIRFGRPEEPISVIRELGYECDRNGAFFSFEQRTQEISLVRNSSHCFVCVTERRCVAEANGRPISSYDECYYKVTVSDHSGITSENWKTYAHSSPAYIYTRSGEGVF